MIENSCSTTIYRPDGSTWVVNDPKEVQGLVACLNKFDNECEAFHRKLMSENVKAYRCNDGWVDRKNYIVTFHSDDKTYGYYWGNLDLKIGDKIFIGDVHDSGKFAIIEEVVSCDKNWGTGKYRYKLIEEPPTPKVKWYKKLFTRK